MNINLKVLNLNKLIPLKIALSHNYVIIGDKELRPSINTILSISTLLFDDNDTEIYENDLVYDSAGNKFIIKYHNGAFFAVKLNKHDKPCNELLPLYILQNNGHVPVKVLTSLK